MNPLDRLGPRPDLAVIRDDVRAIDAYPVPSAVGFVKLDAMENPFSLPEGLQQQLGERLGKQALNRYPLSDPRGFKERLAKSVGLPAGMQLMLGNGSDELIHLIILACAKPGTTVLAPAPSFVMYEMAARFDHCNYVGVPLKENFALDTERMLKAIAEHRPAVIFIAYPNNPTGNLFDRAGIEAILRAAPGIVVHRRSVSAVCAGHLDAAAEADAELAGVAHAVEAGVGWNPPRLSGGAMPPGSSNSTSCVHRTT